MRNIRDRRDAQGMGTQSPGGRGQTRSMTIDLKPWSPTGRWKHACSLTRNRVRLHAPSHTRGMGGAGECVQGNRMAEERWQARSPPKQLSNVRRLSIMQTTSRSQCTPASTLRDHAMRLPKEPKRSVMIIQPGRIPAHGNAGRRSGPSRDPTPCARISTHHPKTSSFRPQT